MIHETDMKHSKVMKSEQKFTEMKEGLNKELCSLGITIGNPLNEPGQPANNDTQENSPINKFHLQHPVLMK